MDLLKQMQNPYYLLKSRRFLPLFIVQFLGAMNDNIYKNALIILISFSLAQQHGLSPKMPLAIATGLFILPFLLFSALAGELADRFDKEKLIQWVKLAEVLILGIAATFGFYLQSLFLMYVTIFLLGTHSTFFGPLKYSILPQHLAKDELLFGNAWIEASTFLAILIGTLLGGLFILQTNGILIISSLLISLALSGWFISFFIPKAKSDNSNLKINYNLFYSTSQIIQYTFNRKKLFQPILGISWFWFIGSSLLTILPLFTKEVLQSNETTTTFLLICVIIGIGIGSLGSYILLQGKLSAKFVPLASLGVTLFSLLMLIKPLSFPSAIGIGICGGFFSVPLYALLQYKSRTQHRSRNIAANNILNALLMVGSSLLAILVFKLGGGSVALLITVALLNLIVTFYMLWTISKTSILKCIVIIIKFVLKCLYRVKINNIENLPPKGQKAIIISNHISLLDAVLIRAFISKNFIYPIDTDTAQKWWVKVFLPFSKNICIDPHSPFSFKQLIHLLEKNGQILIFPEGRISVTGTIMKIYDGTGYLAYKTDAPIFTIHIAGAQFSPFSYLRGKFKIHWFPKIQITLFPPRKLNPLPDVSTKDIRKLLGIQIYNLLASTQVTATNHDITLFEQLLLSAKQNGMQTVIMSDIKKVSLTYKEIIAKSLVLSKILTKNQSLENPIGILMPNCNVAVLKFFALQSTGHIASFLNFSSGGPNILKACQTTNIKCVWSSTEFITHAKLQSVVELLSMNGIEVKFIEHYKSAIKKLKISYILALLFPRWVYKKQFCSHHNAHSLATILFTSGSTGEPKGVAFSHKNFISNYRQAIAIIDLNNQDKMLSIMPAFHAFGLTAGILNPLFHGTQIFLYPTPLHYSIIPEIIYQKQITILFGTNTFLRGYAKYANPYDLRSLRYIFAGAEKIQANLRQIYEEKFGLRILEGYGTTETAPLLTLNTPIYNKDNTVGRLLPTIEYKLKKSQEISSNQELWVKGDNIMLGYMTVKNPGVIEPVQDGWFNTEDVVTIDDEGFITIIGRTKRFAKIGGETVPLNAIEQLANQIWPNHNSACISVPDEQKGELLILFTENPKAKLNDFREFARKQDINPLWIPKTLKIIPKIPLLGSGKPNYSDLKF